MNKLSLSVASLLLAALFINPAFALDKSSVAAVNVKKITQKQYQEHLKLLASQAPQGKKQAPINRQAVLNDLINKEVLLQEAKKKNLHKDKTVKAQLEKIKNNLLIQSLISKSPAG